MLDAAMLRDAVLAIALCAASSAQAQQRPVITRGPVNTDISAKPDWESREQMAKLFLKFDGQAMNNTRAASIAAAGGFDFVGWQTCPSADNCMILEVKGKHAGWVYRYVLLGDACRVKPIASETQIDVHTTRPPPLRTARPSLSGQATAPAAAASGDDGPASASGCFGNFMGGYMVVVRARQHNTFISNSLGHAARFEEIYQAVVGGKWAPFASVVISDWANAIPGSSSVNIGHGYSWQDGAGKELAANVEQFTATPSSGSGGGATAESLCASQRDTRKSKLTLRAEAAAAACLLIPIPTSLTIGAGGSADFKPFGVGGSINLNGSGTKNLDYCATGRNIVLASINLAADQEYDDCIKNPGRYFPSKFRPVSQDFSLSGVLGFEPVTPEAIGAQGACPITKTESINQQISSDMICTTTTHSVCSEQGGECKCTPAPGKMSEVVCTTP